MSLKEQIQKDTVIAQKGGKAKELEVLRFLHAQIKNKEIELRSSGVTELTEEQVLEVVQREAKKRKEAIDLYTQGGRPDLSTSESEELSIISKYLPAPLTREEIEKVVAEVLAHGGKDFGSAMKEVMAILKGKADGKEVGDMIRAKLG